MPRKKHHKISERSDDANAFIPESALKNGTQDDLAQQLAEEHQLSVTTGEDDAEEEREMMRAEEMGGPFIESEATEEFGATMTSEATVDADTPEVEVNPLPEAVGALAIASAEEAEEAREEAREAVEAREEQTGDVDLPDPNAEPPSRVEPNIARLLAPSSRA